MVFKQFCLLFILLLLYPWHVRGATTTEDLFYQKNIELYPVPVPVAKVKREAVIAKSQLSLGYRGFPGAREGTRNQGIHVRITAVDSAVQAGAGPDEQQGIKITSIWKNVHAKQKIDKKTLEKKPDRTMGAGGFFAGSAKRNSDSNLQVEKDVVYKVPRWGDHLFLLADGIAYPIDAASAQLKNGADPSASFILSRQGQEREVQFEFSISASAKNLALQFFDNVSGNIQIPLAGDIRLARGAGFPDGIIDQVKTADLELGVMRIHACSRADDGSILKGWKYLTVNLAGKSNFAKGGLPSFVDIDAGKYVWIEGDGGFAFDPVMVFNNRKKRLRFLPEYFSVQRISFLVPDRASKFRLALRNDSEVIYLKLSGQMPEGPPKPARTFNDGNVAAWYLYSVSRTETALLVDIGVKGLDLKKGLEIRPYRQIRLDGSSRKLKPDQKRSQALAFGAKRSVVVPPGGISRFVMAFNIIDAPESLHIQGLRSRGELLIDDVRDSESDTQITIAAPVLKPVKVAGRKKQIRTVRSKRSAESGKHKTGPGQDKKTTPAVAEKFTLPDWDMALAVQEKEAGDSIENEIDLGKGLSAKGNIGGKSDRADFYYFDVEDEPRLWAIEVAGPTVKQLSYLDASGKAVIKKKINRKTGEARIVNLLLMPGRHRIKISGASKEGGYAVRAIMTGEVQTGKEFEPNDDDSYANRIEIGESIDGLLDDTDQDRFRISLSVREHLQFVLETSTSLKGRFHIGGDVKIHEVKAKQAGETITYEGLLPSGDYNILVRTIGNLAEPEPYKLTVLRKNPFSEQKEAQAELPLAISGPEKVQPVAAYWPQAQREHTAVQVKNQGQTPMDLALSAWTSNADWQARLGMQDITLAPGESKAIPLDIMIKPDAAAIAPVAVAVAARDTKGKMQYQSFSMDAACGVQPIDPVDYFSPPAELLGGLDVAWQGLGAKLIEDNRRIPRTAYDLIDGMTPVNGGLSTAAFKQGKPETFIVKLSGSTPVPVAGFALNPVGNGSSEFWARDFEMDLSSDGKNFTKVLTGSLARLSREQYFVLQKPVMATHARLRVLNNYETKPSRLCLGEWKVIARPGSGLRKKGLNIAGPELGGHVVWRSFKASDFVVSQLLEGSKHTNNAYMLSDLPNEWVIGFQHDRMAQISGMEWERVGGASQSSLKKVRISISREGPSGPWQHLGEWRFSEKDAVSSYPVKTPIWARFIRFTAEVGKSQKVELPKQIRIFEQQTGADYRSIVGEWGHYDGRGPFEWIKSPSAMTRTKEKIKNYTKAIALPVEFEKTYPGTASLGVQDAWYSIVIPEDSNSLEWQLSGYPSLSVRPLLMTLDGEMIPVRSWKISAGMSQYTADVKPGNTYLIKVEEPPRSVVFAWDNSGSVQSYSPNIYQAVAAFAEQITPGREYVNLLPFQYKAPKMLLEEFSDQPLMVVKELNDYSRKDKSSDAELNLKKAINELDGQEGNRAILIITDALSGKNVGKQDLWKAINRVYPRVFSFELHSGKPAPQDKMQDWARVNSGYYSYFRSQADLDVGFDRMDCMLRRPAGFELVVNTKYKKPAGPGKIQVSASRRAANTTVEIILDASGSMYKKLGATTRIATAKSVLKDLMQSSLPGGMPVALRIYGHRKARACDTNLELPLQPFRPEEGVRIIEKVDPKDRSRTPLAESLQLVAEDLKTATDQKLVILLTDGEESCGGDPEEAIRSLREEGLDIRVNIVGLAIDSAKANKQFSNWATLGGGMYFEANDSDDLKSAMEKTLFPKYQLLDGNGGVVLESVADGSSVEVPEGIYNLKMLTTPTRDMGEVKIEEGKTLKVEVKG